MRISFLVSFFIWAVFLFVCCTDKKTTGQIEVNNAKDEIRSIVKNIDLEHYQNIFNKISEQDDVDYIFISKQKDNYTFHNELKTFSGYYDLNGDHIEQTHFEKDSFSKTDREMVMAWLKYIHEASIYGFDIRNRVKIRIFIEPNIYIMFIDAEKFDQQFINQYISKGEDPRGNFYYRLADNVIIATERR